MGSFFKKVGIGAAIGLAFGLMAALSFIGITKVVNTFFPGKAQVSVLDVCTDGLTVQIYFRTADAPGGNAQLQDKRIS